MKRWVSVKERLPEVDVHGYSDLVLCYVPENNYSLDKVWQPPGRDELRWREAGEDVSESDITHWMVLNPPAESDA